VSSPVTVPDMGREEKGGEGKGGPGHKDTVNSSQGFEPLEWFDRGTKIPKKKESSKPWEMKCLLDK